MEEKNCIICYISVFYAHKMISRKNCTLKKANLIIKELNGDECKVVWFYIFPFSELLIEVHYVMFLGPFFLWCKNQKFFRVEIWWILKKRAKNEWCKIKQPSIYHHSSLWFLGLLFSWVHFFLLVLCREEEDDIKD